MSQRKCATVASARFILIPLMLISSDISSPFRHFPAFSISSGMILGEMGKVPCDGQISSKESFMPSSFFRLSMYAWNSLMIPNM